MALGPRLLLGVVETTGLLDQLVKVEFGDLGDDSQMDIAGRYEANDPPGIDVALLGAILQRRLDVGCARQHRDLAGQTQANARNVDRNTHLSRLANLGISEGRTGLVLHLEEGRTRLPGVLLRQWS